MVEKELKVYGIDCKALLSESEDGSSSWYHKTHYITADSVKSARILFEPIRQEIESSIIEGRKNFGLNHDNIHLGIISIIEVSVEGYKILLEKLVNEEIKQ